MSNLSVGRQKVKKNIQKVNDQNLGIGLVFSFIAIVEKYIFTILRFDNIICISKYLLLPQIWQNNNFRHFHFF